MASELKPLNVNVTLTTVSGNNADLFPDTDVSNYRALSIQLTGTWTATVQVQMLLNGSTWVAQNPLNASNTSITNNQIYYFSIPAGVHVRIRTTAYTSGTIDGNISLSSVVHAQQLPYSFDSGNVLRVSVLGNSGSAGIGANAVSDNSNIGNTLSTYAAQALFSPPTGANALKLVRNIEIFKTATATASGDTALWTPTASKKFRLMRLRIEVTADVSTSGGAVIDVILRDASTGLPVAFSFYAPAAAITTNPGVYSTGWIDLGNGILSTTINNILNINLSAALATGKVRVIAVGTEE